MSEDENAMLKRIAYCAEGMLSSENEGNSGDAKEWKQQLKIATEKYYDYLFNATGEQH